MSDFATWFSWVSAIIITVIIMGGILYGCQGSRDAYYQAQKNCIDSGGSWIARGSNNYDADCFRIAK